MTTVVGKLAEIVKAKRGCQCERCQTIGAAVVDALLDQMLRERDITKHKQVVARMVKGASGPTGL